jgi:hypothetical protein
MILRRQLEKEIAEKAIWQELTYKLQYIDPLFNQTNKRKLRISFDYDMPGWRRIEKGWKRK